MKVKMLTLDAGPKGVFPAGSIREVDEKEGKELVKGGYAIEIKPTKKKTQNQQPKLDDFKQMSADDQKDTLKAYGIEGDNSNAEKRASLYEDYLKSKGE